LFLRFLCRGSQIRTDDLLLPKQARYRTALCPECYLFQKAVQRYDSFLYSPNYFFSFLSFVIKKDKEEIMREILLQKVKL
jgi:hypothetical protein